MTEPKSATVTDVSTVGGPDPMDLTLHALRIKGMAAISALQALTGLDEEVLADALVRMESAGRAAFLDKRSLWRITPEGREHHAVVVAAFLDKISREKLATLYEGEFLTINADVKANCSDWQVRDGSPNEHDDADYDAEVVDRLASTHERALTTLAKMTSAPAHLELYPARLETALRALRDGDTKRFTGFGCDSYHDIWMELHEDLLQILGIDRAVEGSS